MTGGAPRYAIERREAGHALVFSGDWCVAVAPVQMQAILDEIGASRARRIACDCRGLGRWDSLLVSTLRAVRAWCAGHQIEFDWQDAPEGARRLLALADEVTPHERPPATHPGVLRLVFSGAALHALWLELLSVCTFAGELVIALGRLLAGRANMRFIDVLWFVQQAGPRAIGIVTLISVLVGMILGYLGSVQLQLLGAQVYVAHLVALGMVREMGALMTGVIMAGRTGAAYAAQLGTMQTREEIDAIVTLGIPPMEFLVLPRLLALTLMMPLLCIYSDVLGICGGAIVAMAMDVTWAQYLNGVQEAVNLTHIATGVAKSVVFGALIAASGCRAGMQCGRSSEAVGQATTHAVVRAIVYLVVADAAFNIAYQRLGI